MIKAVFFDLDGTLLPMEQEKFVKAYFGSLAKRLAPYGFEPEALYAGIWAGMKAMVMNNGEVINEARWWERFDGDFGEKAKNCRGELEAYYKEDFDAVRHSCGHNPMARETIDALKARGLRLDPRNRNRYDRCVQRMYRSYRSSRYPHIRYYHQAGVQELHQAYRCSRYYQRSGYHRGI